MKYHSLVINGISLHIDYSTYLDTGLTLFVDEQWWLHGSRHYICNHVSYSCLVYILT